jgi:hypothetical protein
MFMFQNGLLVTFIPEILMVIGYVLCLFSPGITSQTPSSEQNSVTAHVITFDQQKQISGYQVYAHDFQPLDVAAEIRQVPALFIPKTINSAIESYFSTSDGLSFVDFSRPPPVSVS